MAGDRRQQVVEIMRHAAGKLAYRLHFLALDELRLKRLEFRRIAQDRDQDGLARLAYAVQSHLCEHFLVVAPHTHEFRMAPTASGGGIFEPVGDRAPQTYEQVDKTEILTCSDGQQVARGAV